jgi:predicted methyltransferase
MVSLTTLAHQIILRRIEQGDSVIDATVGNGNDTLFLARKVGSTGHVFGFDIQAAAIESTTKRLEMMHTLESITLFQAGHELMLDYIPANLHRQIKAITFNLGHLPKGNPAVITQPHSSCQGVLAGATMLAPDGVITVLAYQGHEGGAEEIVALRNIYPQLKTTGLMVKEHNSPFPGPTLFEICCNY